MTAQARVYRVRALVPAESFAGSVLGWADAAGRALEHQALLAARRGEVELAPGWAITQATHELLTSPYTGEQIVLAEGVVSGAREPGTPAGDV